MKLTDLAFACLILAAGMLLGNYAADRQTLKACNTHHVAKMIGGGSITCSVNIDTP